MWVRVPPRSLLFCVLGREWYRKELSLTIQRNGNSISILLNEGLIKGKRFLVVIGCRGKSNSKYKALGLYYRLLIIISYRGAGAGAHILTFISMRALYIMVI